MVVPPLLIAACVGVGILVRLAYVAVQGSFRIFELDFVAGDSYLYLELGRSIADGRGIALDGTPTAYVGPAYPIFLGIVLQLGLDANAIPAVQAVLGGCTAGVVALIGQEFARAARLTDRRILFVASVAGFGAAMHPHLIFWTGFVLTETFMTLWAALAVLGAQVAIRTQSPAFAVAAGLAAGVAALTRPPFLAFALALPLALVLLPGGRRAARASLHLIVPAMFCLGALAPVFAWGARNALELGAFVVTSTEAGTVFYQGNSRGATGGTGGYVGQGDYVPLDLPPDLTEVERDRAYLTAALRDIQADPIAAVRRWPAKVWNMWRPVYEGASSMNGIVTIGTYVPTLVLGALGAVWLWRGSVIIPGIFLTVWIVVHVVATGMIRFRVPAEMMLLATMPFGALLVASAIWRLRAPDESEPDTRHHTPSLR